MVVIVEGIDRVGKTTLCNLISKKTGIPIFKYKDNFIKLEKMDSDNESDKIMQLFELCNITESSVIFDRSFVSDFVCGVSRRNYSFVEAFRNFRRIDDFLKSKDCITVFVYPKDLKRSSAEHGSDLSIENMLFNMCSYVMHSSVCYCDYDSIDSLAISLVDIIKKKKE